MVPRGIGLPSPPKAHRCSAARGGVSTSSACLLRLVLSVLTDSALGPQAKAAAKAVDLSPNPHVEAVLLAFQTAKLAADGAAANGYLRRCETPEGQPGSVPGCASRLAELRGGGGGGGAE
jgi:hypothetical protein